MGKVLVFIGFSIRKEVCHIVPLLPSYGGPPPYHGGGLATRDTVPYIYICGRDLLVLYERKAL